MEWWKALQIGVPLILSQITTIVVLIFGFLNQNKRLDDGFANINRRLDEVVRRLNRMERLNVHDRDIAVLKDRTGLIEVGD